MNSRILATILVFVFALSGCANYNEGTDDVSSSKVDIRDLNIEIREENFYSGVYAYQDDVIEIIFNAPDEYYDIILEDILQHRATEENVQLPVDYLNYVTTERITEQWLIDELMDMARQRNS